LPRNRLTLASRHPAPDINRHQLAFTAFDGDLKSGEERCDQGQYDAAARDHAVHNAANLAWPDASFAAAKQAGSDQSHWVNAAVDPREPDVFTFHEHVVAANVPAYVAP
jgi:hypothetical protein